MNEGVHPRHAAQGQALFGTVHPKTRFQWVEHSRNMMIADDEHDDNTIMHVPLEPL
jgi:hypothetical protein